MIFLFIVFLTLQEWAESGFPVEQFVKYPWNYPIFLFRSGRANMAGGSQESTYRRYIFYICVVLFTLFFTAVSIAQTHTHILSKHIVWAWRNKLGRTVRRLLHIRVDSFCIFSEYIYILSPYSETILFAANKPWIWHILHIQHAHLVNALLYRGYIWGYWFQALIGQWAVQ